MQSLFYLGIVAAIVILLVIALLFIYKNHPEYIKKDKNSKDSESIAADSDSFELSEDYTNTTPSTIPSTITDLILEDNLGHQLILQKSDSLLSGDQMLREVLSEGNMIAGHIVQGATPVLGQAYSVAQLQAAAPNGLFTATADKASLSLFKADGTYSTMVRDSSNKLVRNAGFKEVELVNKLNPAVVVSIGMQAMAIISGQYYMTKINKQLDSITGSLEKLVSLHHNEKIAILQNAQRRLIEITGRSVVDTSDIAEIRDLRNKVGEVYDAYRIDLISDHNRAIDYNSKSLRAETRVNEYSQIINQMNFNMNVCAEADRLRIQSYMAEIAVRMKLSPSDPMLPELYESLQRNYDDSLIKQLKDNPEDYYIPINENGEKLVYKGKNPGISTSDSKGQLLSQIETLSRSVIDTYSDTYEGDMTRKMITDYHSESQVIMMIDNTGKQRVFLPAESM